MINMFGENKKIWQSKTFWINTLLILGGLATGLGEMLDTQTAITVIGLANLVIRVFTNQGVDLKL